MKNEETYELWKALKKLGNFSDTYYDKSLLQDMKSDLLIIDEEEIYTLSPEEVLRSFFKALSPLSLMYEDILSLFEQCKAYSSSENIEIKYESSDSISDSFNIKHFLHAKESLQKIHSYQNYMELTEEQVWKLWEIHCENKDTYVVQSIAYREWEEQYQSNLDSWPAKKVDFEQVVNGCLIEEELLKVYAFWKELFYYYRSTGISRKEWRSECYKRNDALLRQETDYCLRYVLKNLYVIAENYAEFSKEEQVWIKEKLDDFIKTLKVTEVPCDILVEKWEQFLQLPVWEKRHEVYSIWIFTQMIAKFPKERISFNISEGVLSFPFSGARIATVIYGDDKFDFWTELRTKTSVKPVGSGRKESIQPDYSIVYGEAENPNDTLVVIECKQYKKSNTKNFSNAIIDYANNRSNAKVLLTDYGEINREKIEEKLGEIGKERYELYSLCRPRTKRVGDFSVLIYESVLSKVHVGMFEENDKMFFSLSWEGRNRYQDLDLYLTYRLSSLTSERRILSFNCKQIPEAEYSGDIQECPGNEKITVHNWNKGIYDIWVNNYTSSLQFSDCQCCLYVDNVSKCTTMKIERPNFPNSSNWWHVLQLNVDEGKINVINKLEEKFFKI